MTPLQVADRVAALLGAPAGPEHGEAVLAVQPAEWHGSVLAVRDDAVLALQLFDVLTAVDDAPGGFTVVLRLWSPAGRHGLQLRAGLPREAPALPTVSDLFAGAAWHERSVHEMFGIGFPGHPNLAPLLLAGGPVHPLRKDVGLASRAVRPWPGSVEPGQSAAAAAPTRRRLQPPGVPAPGSRS